MRHFTRRLLLCLLSGSVLPGLGLMAGDARAQDTVTIGYAVSKSGANAAGAGMTTIPNYQLWVKEVNNAGGLTLPDGSIYPCAPEILAGAIRVARAVSKR